MTRRGKEKLIKLFFLGIATVSILILGLIVVFLFREGVPIFQEVSIYNFLFGKEWYPTYDPPEFGILPLIVGSLVVTVLSSLIAVPLGFFPRSSSRK
jgi:phosphate transport system permease protein